MKQEKKFTSFFEKEQVIYYIFVIIRCEQNKRYYKLGKANSNTVNSKIWLI